MPMIPNFELYESKFNRVLIDLFKNKYTFLILFLKFFDLYSDLVGLTKNRNRCLICPVHPLQNIPECFSKPSSRNFYVQLKIVFMLKNFLQRQKATSIHDLPKLQVYLLKYLRKHFDFSVKNSQIIHRFNTAYRYNTVLFDFLF